MLGDSGCKLKLNFDGARGSKKVKKVKLKNKLHKKFSIL
jgi:hypothetical protein